MADRHEFLTDRLATPIGELAIVADGDGRLRGLAWGDRLTSKRRVMDRHYGPGTYVLVPAADPFGLTSALRRYFAGDLHVIDDLPVATLGSDFQRAVGLANNANPIGIVVPCHRVIGADGRLVGFGGGMDRKRWLLSHESRAGHAPELPF